ncbi:histidine phosphatase family protein [Robbsia sp. KACC 23696]|uniref:histidine phosphatase family protein n=1 Tax=Robbsia sp. KACC 23696 TaxID=3149231 RepID=UPI00325A635C
MSIPSVTRFPAETELDVAHTDPVGTDTTPPPHAEVWLIRHGETAWSKTGQHTGRTDVPLTDTGREQAKALQASLAGIAFDAVWCSPLVRARETCALSGILGPAGAETREYIAQADVQEWDYGIYEGRKTADIRRSEPDWAVWESPMPDGESLHDIAVRAHRVTDGLRKALLVAASEKSQATDGADGSPPAISRIAVFSHGHFLRVLAGTWIGDARLGRHLTLDTATISVLGFDRETPAIRRWNWLPPSRQR